MESCGFLFPGQGAQKPGMGKDFYDKYDIAKAVFERADEILDDVSVRELCFESDEEELKKTENTQPALYTVSYAIYRVLENNGLEAEYYAGHSLGEYSAIAAAGYISFEDGLKLVRKRGILMKNCDPDKKGGMAAIIGLNEKIISDVCKEVGDVVPANYNSPSQIVISGDKVKVQKAAEILKSKGAKRAVVLNVSGAFHSPFMMNAAEDLKKSLESIEWKKGKGKIVSNSTAEVTDDPSVIRENLIKQLYSPVLWNKTMKILVEDCKCINYVECGPGKVLKGLFRSYSRDVTVNTVEAVSDIQSILES